jgi:hypothetical protein
MPAKVPISLVLTSDRHSWEAGEVSGIRLLVASGSWRIITTYTSSAQTLRGDGCGPVAGPAVGREWGRRDVFGIGGVEGELGQRCRLVGRRGMGAGAGWGFGWACSSGWWGIERRRWRGRLSGRWSAARFSYGDCWCASRQIRSSVEYRPSSCEMCSVAFALAASARLPWQTGLSLGRRRVRPWFLSYFNRATSNAAMSRK